MKKSIWLAIIGAAALTGCQSEVMQQREYIPAPRDDAEAVRTATPAADPASTPEVVTQTPAAPQPAVQELPPMTATFDNKGIGDDSAAGAKPAAGGAAGAKTYVVQRGDFPEKIARKNHVSLRALMEANGLDEAGAKRLRVGQKLVIPERGGRKPAGDHRRKGGKRAIGAEAPAASGEYVVKAGDTPEKIARRHHVRISALMEANNLSEDDAKRLQVGQKLVIPARGARKAAGAKRAAAAATVAGATPAAAPAPAPETEPGSDYIAEVPDDMSIAEFAKLNGTTPEKLRELNPEMPEQLVKGASYAVPKK